jgi:hypothetical protein
MVVRGSSFVDDGFFSAALAEAGLPDRFGFGVIDGSFSRSTGAGRVQVIFRRRLLS